MLREQIHMFLQHAPLEAGRLRELRDRRSGSGRSQDFPGPQSFEVSEKPEHSLIVELQRRCVRHCSMIAEMTG
jgi:hypothetical protein